MNNYIRLFQFCLTLFLSILFMSGCSHVKERVDIQYSFCVSEYDVCHDRKQMIKYIRVIELEKDIPTCLLQAIIETESSCLPFSMNISGKPYRFKNKSEAVKKAKLTALFRKTTQMDIGICQLNYKYHGDKFSSISHMFNPIYNIEYAAQMLVDHYKRYKNWKIAVQRYHGSNSAKTNNQYLNRVLQTRSRIMMDNLS